MFVQAVLYFCCFLSGLFLGVFILTACENFSKPFRNFVRKVCDRFSYRTRSIIMVIVMLVMAAAGFLWKAPGMTVSGILCGVISGIFMYFRAGITLGNDPDPYNKGRKKRKKKK